jgi:hypothetical protein
MGDLRSEVGDDVKYYAKEENTKNNNMRERPFYDQPANNLGSACESKSLTTTPALQQMYEGLRSLVSRIRDERYELYSAVNKLRQVAPTGDSANNEPKCPPANDFYSALRELVQDLATEQKQLQELKFILNELI